MLNKLLYYIPMLTQMATDGLDAEKVQQHLDQMSGWEKMMLAFEYGDLAVIITGAALLMGVSIFAYMFIRRWNISRMGYFLISAMVVGVRIQKPDIIFWTPFAFVAGLFSVLMFFLTQKNVDFDSRKEPMYFLFNGMCLLLIAFPMGRPTDFFLVTIALISLLSSLFFVVTKKHVPTGKFKKHDADEAIMNILEKKARRPL